MIETVTLIVMLLIVHPTLLEGRCSACLFTGKRSIVQREVCTRTAMGGMPAHYDEHGVFHPYWDPNRTTCHWRCSNGHELTTDEGTDTP